MRNKLEESIALEVAVEMLGEDQQRFIRAIVDEEAKDEPSKLLTFLLQSATEIDSPLARRIGAERYGYGSAD